MIARHSYESVDGATPYALLCRYEVVEAAAGATRLYGASLPPNKVGPQVRVLMHG